jgi:hypothetical protein
LIVDTDGPGENDIEFFEFYGHGSGKPGRELSNFFPADPSPGRLEIPFSQGEGQGHQRCPDEEFVAFIESHYGPEDSLGQEFIAEGRGIHMNFSEKYLMLVKAMISRDIDRFKQIKSEKDPGTIKQLGREVSLDVDLWDRIRFPVMLRAGILKLADEKFLKELATHRGGSDSSGGSWFPS